jgi:CRISPR system Cascade subunit CasE
MQESEPRRKIGLLHRLEQGLAGHPVLLVQSLIQPDWSTLPADYCLPALSGVENPAVKPIADVLRAIQNGTRYRFRLTANPTRRITRGVPANGGTPSARVELRTEEQWTDWMLRQSQKHGFRVERLRADPTLPNLVGLLAGRLQGRRNGDRVTVFAVRFDGVLEVVNVDEFREAIRSGVGPAKAYGCGLLSIGSTAQLEQTPGKLEG